MIEEVCHRQASNLRLVCHTHPKGRCGSQQDGRVRISHPKSVHDMAARSWGQSEYNASTLCVMANDHVRVTPILLYH
jgi:hypothetical protein